MYSYYTLSEITQEVQTFINEHMNCDHRGFWNSEVCTVDDQFVSFIENEMNQFKVTNFCYDELKLEVGSYSVTISMNNVWDKWKITQIELLSY